MVQQIPFFFNANSDCCFEVIKFVADIVALAFDMVREYILAFQKEQQRVGKLDFVVFAFWRLFDGIENFGGSARNGRQWLGWKVLYQ